MKNKKLENSFDQLLKYGYIYIENVLNEDDIEKFSNIMKNHHENINKPRDNNISNSLEYWELISNRKIINSAEKVIKEKIFYMDGTSSIEKNSQETISKEKSWHRDTDSVEKIDGVVPYCKLNDHFRVFTITTYPKKTESSYISLIPASHKSDFRNSFKNLLRIFHWRTCGLKYFKYINKIIERIISLELEIKNGDCLIFFSTLFHKPITKHKKNDDRLALILRYAPEGIAAKNYIEYVLKKSSRKIAFDNKNKLKFLDYLKKNNLLSKHYN